MLNSKKKFKSLDPIFVSKLCLRVRILQQSCAQFQHQTLQWNLRYSSLKKRRGRGYEAVLPVANFATVFKVYQEKVWGNYLKGHGNKADFLGFLQKLVPHESLRLPFEPFRFRLRIRGDIRNRKKTPRLGESGSRLLNFYKKNPRVGESGSRRLSYSRLER
jgi:hypothetical protein